MQEEKETQILIILGKNVLPRVLTDALHVPGIAKNLFSVSAATSQGHAF
jgi:hypothetical protein